MDYRRPLADKLRQKRAKLRWIPRHREDYHATNPAEKEGTRRDNEVGGLAKGATLLPLEEKAPVQPHNIVIAGAEAPTLAKKGVNICRRYGDWTGCHGTTSNEGDTTHALVSMALGKRPMGGMCCAVGQEQSSLLGVQQYAWADGPQATHPVLKMEGNPPADVGQELREMARLG